MTSLPPILLWQEKVVCQKKTRATDGNTATLWASPTPQEQVAASYLSQPWGQTPAQSVVGLKNIRGENS